MATIKSNQVIDVKPLAPNPVQAAPRDLAADFSSYEINFDVTTDTTPVPTEANPTPVQPVTPTASVLGVPMVTAVKSQNISYQGDGSVAIDVVITVTDISGATEYDVKITKNAGLL